MPRSFSVCTACLLALAGAMPAAAGTPSAADTTRPPVVVDAVHLTVGRLNTSPLGFLVDQVDTPPLLVALAPLPGTSELDFVHGTLFFITPDCSGAAWFDPPQLFGAQPTAIQVGGDSVMVYIADSLAVDQTTADAAVSRLKDGVCKAVKNIHVKGKYKSSGAPLDLSGIKRPLTIR